MDRGAEVEELRSLLRSRAPVLLVETHEEVRVLGLLAAACAAEGEALFRWSLVDGLVRADGGARGAPTTGAGAPGAAPRPGGGRGVYQTASLVDALRHVDATTQPGVYAFCDAHPGFTDPLVVRLVREVAMDHARVGRTLAFVSPRLDAVPPELARLAAHFRPHLPTRAEIEAIVLEEAEDHRRASGRDARGDAAVVEMLVLQLLGLEEDDVRRLVRQALRTDGELNGDDLRRVLDTKYAALGGAGVLGFEHRTARFADVGGLGRLKHWLALRRAPFLAAGDGEHPDRPRGIVLLGVQGGGKSLAARAVAGEWGVPLMRLDFSALHDKFHGETERNLRRALATAEGMAPCVLWIDEIEKGVAVEGGGDGDSGVSRRVLGSFLTWLAERRHAVFVVATANDISRLPPELVRKGRFDEIFFVDLPGPAARRAVARIHLGRRGHDPAAFDLDRIAAASAGCSGAEIEQAVVGATFETAARGAPLTSADVEAELARTRPLSVVMAERVAALRAWAATRAVLADDAAEVEGVAARAG